MSKHYQRTKHLSVVVTFTSFLYRQNNTYIEPSHSSLFMQKEVFIVFVSPPLCFLTCAYVVYAIMHVVLCGVAVVRYLQQTKLTEEILPFKPILKEDR